MKTKRITQITPFEDHERKLQRAVASRQTRISIAVIAHVALELARKSDGTIENFDHYFKSAYNLLTSADQKLFTLHSELSKLSNGVNSLSETTDDTA